MLSLRKIALLTHINNLEILFPEVGFESLGGIYMEFNLEVFNLEVVFQYWR